nr:F-box protein [Legionella gresilensis]
MPDELSLQIFNYLPPSDIAALSVVCKRFNGITQDKLFKPAYAEIYNNQIQKIIAAGDVKKINSFLHRHTDISLNSKMHSQYNIPASLFYSSDTMLASEGDTYLMYAVKRYLKTLYDIKHKIINVKSSRKDVNKEGIKYLEKQLDNYYQIISLLIKYQAKIDIVDSNNYTPLSLVDELTQRGRYIYESKYSSDVKLYNMYVKLYKLLLTGAKGQNISVQENDVTPKRTYPSL